MPRKNLPQEFDFPTEFARLGESKDRKTEDDRPLSLCRPCNCGCDFRGGKKGVGYITGGNTKGFFTIWIQNEETYQAVTEVFKAMGLRIFQPGT